MALADAGTAILMLLLVALSRLYRGEHHPTDPLGSLLLAALRVTATYLAIRPNADIDDTRNAAHPGGVAGVAS